MGLLELHKAMLQVVKRSTPTLHEIVGEAVFLKVDEDILNKTAAEEDILQAQISTHLQLHLKYALRFWAKCVRSMIHK